MSGSNFKFQTSSMHLCGLATNVGGVEVPINADGIAEVGLETAQILRTIPSWTEIITREAVKSTPEEKPKKRRLFSGKKDD